MGARPVVLAQEPVRLAMLRSLRPDDRPRPPPISPVDPLNPEVPYHHSHRHTPFESLSEHDEHPEPWSVNNHGTSRKSRRTNGVYGYICGR
ncbi:hypothetical protein GFS60_06718 (plasmid) [Rhodococcus sp. WAY2]|nr:hypothetical protein GFS60_06456 [Rhodococcus sp. WAY2]QHE73067.1 hypothetical protein GFS60_06718 [Rhodococcus sp. WAY2]